VKDGAERALGAAKGTLLEALEKHKAESLKALQSAKVLSEAADMEDERGAPRIDVLRAAHEAAAAARQLVELGSDRLLSSGFPHRARPRSQPKPRGAGAADGSPVDLVVAELIRELNAATALLGTCLSALDAERQAAQNLEALLEAANEGMRVALARIEALEGADADAAQAGATDRATLTSEVAMCRPLGEQEGVDASTQTIEMSGAATDIQRMLRGMRARRDVQKRRLARQELQRRAKDHAEQVAKMAEEETATCDHLLRAATAALHYARTSPRIDPNTPHTLPPPHHSPMPPPHTPIHTPTQTPAHTHQSPTSATRLPIPTPPPTPPTSPMKQHGGRETTGLLVSGQAVTRTVTRSELPCFHEITHEVAAAQVFDRRRPLPSGRGGGGGGCCEGLRRYVRWWLFGWKEERVGGEGWGVAGVRTPWGGGGSLLQRERERERERALRVREQKIGLPQGGGGMLCVEGGGEREGGRNSGGWKKVQWDLMGVKMLHVCICRCVPQTLNPKH
jgi:hypothetical protein